ncbi:MAG: phosphonate C-P lyase system protein PhnH [Halofilum sp. (in: g-proteobacteria)]
MNAPQPGFADPVADAQGVFRAALAAMSHPGRVERIDTPATAPPPFSRAAAALALTLIDESTPIWLDTTHMAGTEHLQFHCGARVVDAPARADFAIARAGACPQPDAWACGTALEPHRSATLVLEVDALGAGERYRLRGPGIADTRVFACRGLPRAWLAARAASAFPCGLDLFLTSGDLIAALPRTTRVEA